MAIATQAITDQLVTYAANLGWFDRINAHEPKGAPGNGITAAVWVQNISPLADASGLASTTGLIVFNFRVYQGMLSEPQDAIDPALVGAVDALMTSISGDFDLNSNIRNVDLLGRYSLGLNAQAGYETINQVPYRIMTITIPLVVNDLWTQVA